MNGKIEQELHEKLCAYVLGESEGADRAEVERELLRSTELRAEKERLEATIGAVRHALAPVQTLAPEAREALERAVRPAPIARFPWLRLAAGIGAVGLGWWVFARGGALERRHDVTVATREERAGVGPADGREASARDLELIERAKNGWNSLSAAEKDAVANRLSSLGYSGGAPAAPATAASAPPQELAPSAGLESGLLVDESRALDASSVSTVSPTLAKVEFTLQDAREPRIETGAVLLVAKNAEAGQPTDLAVRLDDLALQGVPPASAPAPTGGTSHGGTYKGPGDSISPVQVGYRAAGEGSSGPSTPAPLAVGPSGPSAGGTKAGSPPPAQEKKSDGVDAGAARGDVPGRAAAHEEETGLTALGYTGNDDFYVGDADAAKRARQQGLVWSQLTPEQQTRHIELRCGRIVRDCLPRPSERPRDMFFRFWGDNPFEVTLLDKLSTFSVDVDTASYTLARRYIVEGRLPEKAQVRTEEFVNYFASDVDAPRKATFAVHSDLTPSRFSADAARRMLRVVVRAKDVEKAERDPMRLTFVVDVSGSMKEQNRLETVKHALRMLVAQLEPRDSIALVKFSNDASLVLPMTPVRDRAAIEAAIAPLAPNGSTNSNAGLQLGYAQALQALEREAVNRVVFLSDGVANVGETDAQKITDGVKGIREKGIYLNTIGVGMNNHNDALLEQLANLGDGVCNYVDDPKEIQRALVDRFTGAFQPVAKDVKIQVEFDPAQVMRYRLLGYENRAIADADFRNDAVDAGEIGAGHQVTALYEIEPTGAAGDGPMATVRLRWKPIRPAGESGVQEATEAAFDVHSRSYKAYEAAPTGHRRALIVAQYAEILRRSIHARGDSLEDLIREATLLQAQIPTDTEFAEFTALLVRSKELVMRTLPACDEMCQTVDALRTNTYLGAVFQETGRDPAALAQVEAERQKLEARLREILIRQARTGGAQPLESLGYTDEPR